MFLGYKARNTVRKICCLAFPFFFKERKKERMTLSAIHLDGGENFRLCMGLLQHHFFSLFFKFQHDCRCTRMAKKTENRTT